MKDVHPTDTAPTEAVAHPHTLAHDHPSVEEETTGAMIGVTTKDAPLANTNHTAVVFHGRQTRADESHTPAPDDQIPVHHLANTEKGIPDVVRLLRCGQGQTENLPRPDVVHHQAMNHTATVVLDHQETTETTDHPDNSETTIVLLGTNAQLLQTMRLSVLRSWPPCNQTQQIWKRIVRSV